MEPPKPDAPAHEALIEQLLDAALAHDHGDADLIAESQYARGTLRPLMGAVRVATDSLETLVADDLWPLPNYQEMLYIK